MTVADIEETMSNDEFVRWAVYYGKKRQREQLEMLKAKRRG
jgi:hypothetical protein